MRPFVSVFVVLCLACPVLGVTPAEMPANSWLELAGTPMKAVAADMSKFPKVHGVVGPRSVIIAWGGAALDTKRNRLVLWGGGHADYYGNELYAFDINKLVWQRLTDPFPNPVKDQEINADGTPNSRHTYNGLAYLTHADRFFAQGGALAGVGFAKCDVTWTFDFATKKWEDRKPTGTLPGGGIGQCCAYDPRSKKLYYGNNKGLFSYDYDQNRWVKLNNDSFYYHTLAVDTKRGLLIGAGGKALFAYDLNQKDFRRRNWKSSGAQDLVNAGNPGLDYDPLADKIVGWHKGKVYVLDIPKRTWTVKDVPGGPKDSRNGTYGRWRYVPAVNVFILVTDWDRNVFFYKHTAGLGRKQGSPALP
jgi:hypothetical protein